MGADIYLNSVFEPNIQKYKPLFEEAVKARDELDKSGKTAQELGESYIACQQKVEEMYELMYSVGYFRDPYNSSSTLSKLGVSWFDDVIPRLAEGTCLLYPKDCQWLYDRILDRLIGECPVETAELKYAKRIIDTFVNAGANLETSTETETGSMSAEELQWHQHKKTKLLQLLAQAIELNEPLECSL